MTRNPSRIDVIAALQLVEEGMDPYQALLDLMRASMSDGEREVYWFLEGQESANCKDVNQALGIPQTKVSEILYRLYDSGILVRVNGERLRRKPYQYAIRFRDKSGEAGTTARLS